MKIAMVGLGYVGLPIAAEFAKFYPVIGFDLNENKISELRQGVDKTNEVESEKLKNPNLSFTSNSLSIKEASFVIVAVPTPIEEHSKQPDLSFVESASKIVGQNLKPGAIVVFESTVYPGTTEEICKPIIEKESGMRCGEEWKIAYSPERIVPGDKVHTLNTITKVVSGMDKETLDIVSSMYSRICPVYKAASIKVAEAVKVVENVQRDLNIALVNELSLIFHKLDIDTKEVLDAAATKFNFHKYYPGLVGGHCISVDPYYMAYIAKKKGYYPKIILSGREVNEDVALHIAKQVLKNLNESNKILQNCKVLVMGLTFKENVPDMRNSKVKELINELKSYNVKVYGMDPLLSKEKITKELGIENMSFEDIGEIDAVVVAQGHECFRNISLEMLKAKLSSPYIFDIKRFYDKNKARELGFTYDAL